MPTAPDEGFVKADSRNLPEIHWQMVGNYLVAGSHGPEQRFVKMERSGKKSYVGEAVGYVQIKRDGLTHVRASMCPEHRVRAKMYIVNCILDEGAQKILKAFCENCAACLGGCKHAVGFLFWLHHKNLEPSSTSITNYWIRPRLAQVGTTVKSITTAELSGSSRKRKEQSEAVKEEFLAESAKALKLVKEDVTLKKHLYPKRSLSLHSLASAFKCQGGPQDGEAFIKFSSSLMTSTECKVVASETRNQSQSPLWHEMRFGRITASILFKFSRCQTVAGSLVNSVLGAVKFKPTTQMKRGLKLESAIVQQIEKKFSVKVRKEGLVLRKEFPIFGASPDGLFTDYVLEIKCPASPEAYPTYFNAAKTGPSEHYFSQMQLQMLMCGKAKGIYCVADVNFEENQKITTLEVTYDDHVIKQIMKQAQDFWLQSVFPRLMFT